MIILKILLWIFLVVLGVLLAAICYLVFSPIIYDILVKWDGERYICFSIHDLVHIVSGKVRYEARNGLTVNVKLFGIKEIINITPETDEEDAPSPEEEKEASPGKTETIKEGSESTDSSDTSNDIKGSEKALGFEVPENVYEVNFRETPQNAVGSEDKITINAKIDVSEETIEPKEDISKAADPTEHKTENPDDRAGDHKNKKENTSDAASKDDSPKQKDTENAPENDITGKFELLKSYLSEECISGIKYIISCVFVLLKKLIPHIKRIQGRYSLTSPDYTGQMFGLFCLMPVMYRKGNYIEPDFESEDLYFDGEIFAVGKIKLLWLISLVIKILINKNSRTIIFKVIGG
ncbi:MAG: hypothetical protein K6F00_00885 [Lachnospiraceae bacterium]|nr:hypothetical protein [Lachnospiraceae bacterium]